MGKAALEGQAGVIDVVKALRQRPFGEWDVVYYDPAKTNVDTLMALVKKSKGCEKAARVTAAPLEKSGLKVTAENPIITPGDLVQITVEITGKDARLRSLPPPDWIPLPDAPGGKTETGRVMRLDVQSPATARPGKQTITLQATLASNAVEEFKVEVEVVSRVK